MMNGKEKLYFLLDAIEDARIITPSGRVLTIDPLNDLNKRLSEKELSYLFIKLAEEEKVLKLIKAPQRAKTELDELDPYDHADDGCWHVELLSAFNRYFLEVQHEPEYQEFTGRKPADTPTINKSGLMTYGQKLDLIVNAVVEANKATRTGQPTTLYLNSTNGLDELEREEIRNILLQLQDEGAFKLNPKTNRLLPIHQQPANPGYFLLDDIDNFDDWYAGYLLKQRSKPENLDWLNLLKILDVCNDIEQQLQMTRNNKVSVQSFPYPYLGRFLDLFPYDSVGTRKSYQQYRWEGAQYLQKEGVVSEARYDNDDMLGYGTMIMRINLVKFYDFYKTIKEEFKKRKESFSEDGKPVTTPKIEQPAPEEVNWSDDFRWEDKNFVFGKYGSISFTSDDRRHILKILSDKKGGWATLKELRGNKDDDYVRSTIKQIEDRLPEEAKEHVLIVSTQDDNSKEKPSVGAYRIKIKP